MTVRQAGTRCKTTESNTIPENDRRKHLIIQNATGAAAHFNFDTSTAPNADGSDCALELIDLEIIHIPNFTGSVITHGDQNVKVRFMEFE